MMDRRSMFLGLAGTLTATLGLAAAAQAAPVAAPLADTANLGHRPAPGAEAEAEGNVQLAQFHGPGPGPRGPGPGPGFRRGPRCWNETRNVRFRDRFGRVQFRTVSRRVCR